MELRATEIPDVKMVTPKRIRDARGFFSEVYNLRDFAKTGIEYVFVQENHSLSIEAGTVRGLHFQFPPMAQTKLIRVLRGRILDVAVDIRAGSPTFGQHVMVELSAEAGNQILLPRGFAHGCMTLEPYTELLYKVDAYWSPEHEGGVHFADPDLGIAWPSAAAEVTLSPRDRKLPVFANLPRIEVWE